MQAQFHLALPCENIETTRNFYVDILGASKGRQADKWSDINLYNHQLTFTEAGDFNFDFKNYKLGDSILPSFHFGVIIPVEEWGKLYSKLFQSNQEVTTEATFMEDKIGEHLSFFIADPNGYMIEFKSFKNDHEVFSS
ncbi:bleomycin resistance protein [Maribacter algarum]|uniref:Bleomycin resistance protein n=1 Tax=Maribacter algarum (ex Zhang et al. 2020) TaxID=2578118 RepID=A0A5S3QJ66_9FLAO|nr:VOC family protein [Maribacter algarum]TMM57864.1 bleomycin resistance protein [Maribacter algarum]